MGNWRDVVGYEGLYRISDTGLVMSVRRNKLMALGTNHQGYRTCALSRDGKSRRFMVHRLVLQAFVGPCPEGMETLHRNDTPGDNRLENLRWGTHAENIEDMKRNGNFNSGRRNGKLCRAGLHDWVEANRGLNSEGRDVCKECQLESWRRARKRGLDADDPRHGTVAGGRRGCRCGRCEPVFREYRSEEGKKSYRRMKEKRNGS